MNLHAKEYAIISFVFLLTYIIPKAESLNCYVTEKGDVSNPVETDCQMHTGCIKKYNKKTQQTLEKGCYLTPPGNATCSTSKDDKNVGICFCTTDLCNDAQSWVSHPTTSWIFRTAAWAAFITFLIPMMAHNRHLAFT